MPSLSVLQILRAIKERQTVSRTELQHLTNLSWGTVTNTTRELLTRNFIRETGARNTKTGRKPVQLSLDSSRHALLGVDLAPQIVRAIALNLAGETLWYAEQPYAMNLPPDRVLTQVAELLRQALAEPFMAGRTCLGVGVAAQGAVDVQAGIMRFAPPMPGWTDVPLREALRKMLDIPVLIEHDPNCLALAERWFGAAAAAEDVLCIGLSDGVGMGILLHGEIFRGAQQMAGEFGHITVDPDGPPCACGDRGCIEAFCSVSAVHKAVRDNPAQQSTALREIIAQRTPTIAELIAAARQDDAAVRAAFVRLGRYLGLGIANVIDLFNPALIVLCGPLTAGHEFFLPELQQQVQRHAWQHSQRHIVLSTLGPRAIAIGACGAVLQSLFERTDNGK